MLDTDHWRLYKVYWNNYKKMCGVVNGVCHRLNRELTQSEVNIEISNINKIQVVRYIWSLLCLKDFSII
jgi:hypothetical protein